MAGVHRGGASAGVHGGDAGLAGLRAGRKGGGTGEGDRLHCGDIGELGVADRAGVGEHQGVAISATVNRVRAGQSSDGEVERVGTSVALQVQITAAAGGDGVSGRAAQYGFKT